MSQPWPWIKFTERLSSTFPQTHTSFVPNIDKSLRRRTRKRNWKHRLNDTRKMWQNIEMVLNNLKQLVSSPLHIYDDNKIEWHRLKIANEFNKYFTGTYHWDIANKFLLQTRTIFVNIYYVYTESSFSFNTATPSDVCKTILQLKPTNSAGHDKMPKTYIYIQKKKQIFAFTS